MLIGGCVIRREYLKNLWIKMTEETKRKISETLKRKGIKPKVRFNATDHKYSNERRIRHKNGLEKAFPPMYKICGICKEKFKISPARENTAKYCSLKCANKAMEIEKPKCIRCGLELKRNSFKIHQKCMNGIYSPIWKGGFTQENIKIRQSVNGRFWRKSVFQRDNFTCQKSGKKGGGLEAHHINNFADFPELRFAIDNGITFSIEVHKEFHKKYGFKNNTREQLEEFLNQKVGEKIDTKLNKFI